MCQAVPVPVKLTFWWEETITQRKKYTVDAKKKKLDEGDRSVGSGEDGAVFGDSLSDEDTLEQKPE